MSNPWIVLAGIVALALLYVVLPVVTEAFRRFRGGRRVECPGTSAPAEVRLDAGHAALTSAFGPPDVRVENCSNWPERAGCSQGCLERPGVEVAEPASRV